MVSGTFRPSQLKKKGSKLKWKLSIESLRQQEGETLDDAAEFKSLILTLIW